MNTSITSRTILFVTGAFVTNESWQEWKNYFESRGYTTHNPAWPHKDASPAVLRQRNPDKAIASNQLKNVVDHYEQFARSLPEKPIAIGHSFGGLVTQLLLGRGVIEAGVAVHSAPPQGLLSLKPSFFRANWKNFGLFTDLDKSNLMSFSDWQYAFTNGLPLDVQRKSYEANVLPESKRLFRTALTSQAKVDYTKPHGPLLFTAGTTDHIVPLSMNRTNYKKYVNGKGGVVAFKAFEGRNHYVVGQEGWQDVAGYIHEWLQKQ